MLELVLREVDLLVARLRGFGPARFAAAAPPLGTRADVVRHLAARLVELGSTGHRLPELPVAALADVVAVVGHDLAVDLPDGPGRDEVLAAALAELLLHRYEVDGAPPGPRTAAAALRLLAPDAAPDPGALLAIARRRCPAYA